MQKILLIDDDQVFLKTTNDFLSSKGYKIFEAKDGEVGLKVAKEEKPDLILLDIIMPNIGGMNFLKIRQDDEELKKIPVLVISNLGNMNTVNESLKLGVRGYIIKSDESLKTTVSTIESVMGKNQVS